MPQSPEATRAKIQKRRTSKAAAKLPPAPKRATSHVADDKSNANRARSETYQKSPAYRKQVRKVYDVKSVRHVTRDTPRPGYELGGAARPDFGGRSRVTIGMASKRPLAERKALLHAAETARAPSPAQNAILALHKSRSDRAKVLRTAQLQHDVTTADDRKRIAKFVQTEDYKTALSDAAFAGAKARGLDERKAADAASRAYDSGAKRALDAKRTLTAGVAPSGLDKAVAPLRHKLTSTALWSADQVSRPVYGIAGAADAATGKHRGNVWRGFKRGVTLKDRTLFSDVLKDAGAPKWVSHVAGFGLDVALDPTTYLTLGTGIPAEIAAKGAYRAVLRAGEREVTLGDLTQTELERQALGTARKVYEGHGLKSRGLKVGLRGTPVKLATRGRTREVMHSGAVTRGTARASQAVKDTGSLLASPLPAKVKAAASAAKDRAGRDLIHDYRPRNIDPVTWEFIRGSTRDFRAGRAKADRIGTRRALMLRRELRSVPDDRRLAIIHAVEAKSWSGLSEHEKHVGLAIRSDLEAAYSNEVDNGILLSAGDLAKTDGKVKTAKKRKKYEGLHAKAQARADKAAERPTPLYSAAAHAEAEGNVTLAKALKKRGDTLTHESNKLAKKAVKLERKIPPPHGDLGYWPRYLQDHVFPLHQGAVNPTGGAIGRITGNFTKGRKEARALADLPPDRLAEYDLRIPEAVGRRVRDGGRAVATKQLHDRMAALGDEVSKTHLAEALKIKKGKLDAMNASQLGAALARLPDEDRTRLLFHDGKGFRPLQNKRGQIDAKAVYTALKANRPVVHVEQDVFHAVDELADRGRNAWSGQLDRKGVLGAGFDTAQGHLKTFQTVVNPGYHITNLIGDSFNARVGGATVGDFKRGYDLKRIEGKMDKAQGKLHHLATDVTRGKSEYYAGVGHKLDDADVVDLASQHGAIHNGMGGHELNALVKGDTIKAEGRVRPMSRIRGFNEKREDLTRLASFHGALKRGMTPSEAADWVNKHHFDYADLTDTERNVLRRLIPFYTFMSRNTRLQVGSLARRPGVYANAEKARQESTRAGDMSPTFANTLRDFEQAGVPWGTPLKLHGDKLMVFPKLPLTDLNNLNTSPGQMWANLIGRGSPLLKVAIEQSFKLNTFTHSQYESRVPAPSVFKNGTLRAAFNEIVAKATGKKNAIQDIQDPTSGKMVPGWSFRFDELLRQVPATSQAVNATVPSRAGRAESWQTSLAGYALGPRPQQYQPGVVKLNQLQEEFHALDTRIKDLKKTVPHTPGAKWHGHIAELSKKLNKLDHQIYKQSKALGAKHPQGSPPPKGRKKNYGLGGGLGSSMGDGLGGNALGG